MSIFSNGGYTTFVIVIIVSLILGLASSCSSDSSGSKSSSSRSSYSNYDRKYSDTEIQNYVNGYKDSQGWD